VPAGRTPADLAEPRPAADHTAPRSRSGPGGVSRTAAAALA
jgi:hypothetical protein